MKSSSLNSRHKTGTGNEPLNSHWRRGFEFSCFRVEEATNRRLYEMGPQTTRGSCVISNVQLLVGCNFLLFALLLAQLSVEVYGLRMMNLDVPQSATQGDSVELSCLFELQSSSRNHNQRKRAPQIKSQRHRLQMAEVADNQLAEEPDESNTNQLEQQSSDGEQLYAIKWYKDGREFFRFLEKDWPRKQSFPMDGVSVDFEKSNNETVILKRVQLKTSGLFRCEVSTDAPFFVTRSLERRMVVISPPKFGPEITASKPLVVSNGFRIAKHYLGDQLEFSCSSRDSKPAAPMDWIINERLNLSAASLTSLSSNGTPLFEVTNRKFVRLPLAIDDPQNKVPIAAANGQLMAAQSTKHLPEAYGNYELIDGTYAVSLEGDSPTRRAAINVAHLLNQLMETSSTKLKFTVDTNLLHLIASSSRSSERFRTTANPISSSGHKRAKRETNVPFEGQFVLFQSSPIQVQLAPDAELRSRQTKSGGGLRFGQTFAESKNSMDRSSYGSNGQLLENQVLQRQSPTRPDLKRRLENNQLQTTRDNVHRSVLRLRCVLREMNMDDEIKLHLIDKDREKNSNEDMAHIEAQRRQRPSDNKGSGATSKLRGGSNIGAILFIAAVTLALLSDY